MPSLKPTGRVANLKRAFDVFVETEFTASFLPPTAAINYIGTRFDESPFVEWIEPQVLGPTASYGSPARYLNATERSNRLTVILQIHIFVRQSQVELAHRIQQLRDLIASKMVEGVAIPVKDWEGDRATIGHLIVRRVSMDQEMPTSEEAEDLQQWVYAVECEWFQEYTTP